MSLDLAQFQRGRTMSDSQAEDRQLLELVLQAQQLQSEIDAWCRVRK